MNSIQVQTLTIFRMANMRTVPEAEFLSPDPCKTRRRVPILWAQTEQSLT